MADVMTAKKTRRKLYERAKAMIESGDAAKRAAADELMNEIEALTDYIDGAEMQPEARTITAPSTARAPEFFHDVRSGEKIRVYGRGEALPVEQSSLSLGSFVRGVVTGEWEKREEPDPDPVSGATTGAGGYLIPSPLAGQVIQDVRNRAAVFQAGARTIDMPSRTLRLAKVATVPEGVWTEENEAGTFGEMTFTKVDLDAKKFMLLLAISNEILEDAANIDAVIREVLSANIALQLDQAFLLGDGAAGAGVEGLSEQLEAGQKTASETVPSYDAMLAEYFTLLSNNVSPDNVSAIWNADVAEVLAKQRETAEGGAYLAPPADYNRILKVISNQIPTAQSKTMAFLGDFSQMVIGMRRQISIAVSGEAGDSFEKDQTYLRISWRGDMGILHADHFREMSDLDVS